MKTEKTKHIPMRHYKVLLLQMARRIIERVCETGLKPKSKRAKITQQIYVLMDDLEREFKRDVTLKESAKAKKDLYMELYKGVLPTWLLDTMFHSLTEESKKLNKKAS